MYILYVNTRVDGGGGGGGMLESGAIRGGS